MLRVLLGDEHAQRATNDAERLHVVMTYMYDDEEDDGRDDGDCGDKREPTEIRFRVVRRVEPDEFVMLIPKRRGAAHTDLDDPNAVQQAMRALMPRAEWVVSRPRRSHHRGTRGAD